MRKTIEKRLFTGLLAASLIAGTAFSTNLRVKAEEGDEDLPDILTDTLDTIDFIGDMPGGVEVRAKAGLQGAIAVKGTEPDWSKAVTANEDNVLLFDNLLPATQYKIYVREKDGKILAELDYLSWLNGVQIEYENTNRIPIVGQTLTAVPDPADAEIDWQWFYFDEQKVDENLFQTSYIPIYNATSATYTIQKDDVGKTLAVKAYLGDKEYSNGEDRTSDKVVAADQLAPASNLHNEWAGGIWYDKNGLQTYEGVGSWKHNKKGWWYQDSKGWYPKNQWQLIDSTWYFFKKNGYMAQNEYVNGYWFNKDGSWTYPDRASWKKDSKGWWFGDASGWYAKNKTYTINGVKYTFNKAGYWVE